MNQNTKGAIAVGITLGVVGLAYYFLVYRKKNGGSDDSNSDDSNFKAIQDNLGVKSSSSGIVSVKFNEGKNTADFYKNNRVVIGKIGTSGYLVKGSYSDGGKGIKLDNGKEIFSGSVFGNLLQTLK
jgi:hypothetical protein